MTIYETMQHNYTHGIREKGVATLLHPLGDDAFALQFHETDVVVAYEDGSVKLDSGGYSTPHYAWSNRTKTVSPTTRERISRYLPDGYRIDQRSWKWVLVQPSGQEVEFKDGMIINTEEDQAIQDALEGYALATYYERNQP